MSPTTTETKQPCASERINTRRHCTLHLEDSTRCRKYARRSCTHGLHCEEHDIFLHTVIRRVPGDFICCICGEHFLDKEAPEVSEHIGAHAEQAGDRRLVEANPQVSKPAPKPDLRPVPKGCVFKPAWFDERGNFRPELLD